MTDSDPLAARLAQIRERNEVHIKAMAFTEWTVQREPCGNVRLLLGAVEAALAVAGEWRDAAADLDRRAGVAADEGDSTGSALLSYRAQAHADCAARLERVVAAELPGESRPQLRERGE